MPCRPMTLTRPCAAAVAVLAVTVALGACDRPEEGFGADKEREAREMMRGARTGPGSGLGPMGPTGGGPGIMMGPGLGMMGPNRQGDANLSREEVEAYFVNYLARSGARHYRVGAITETEHKTFIVEIVTREGAPVSRYEVDRHTGLMRPAR